MWRVNFLFVELQMFSLNSFLMHTWLPVLISFGSGEGSPKI